MEWNLRKARAFFRSGRTRALPFRREALERLERAILKHEAEIYAALRADLNKSETEAYLCEVGLTLSELRFMRRHFMHWAGKRRIRSSLAQFPATCFYRKEPYGVVLILSPWNYPFLLTMLPLIGAIAAGNCVVVKPSADAPATATVIGKILKECFPTAYVTAIEGGTEESRALLRQRFDYIFFTGGAAAGREVMAKAAEHLTPVTLELGGKSPCVIEKTARIDLAAKRIVFGKLLNGGQTCVAPDYILVERGVKEEFVAALKKWIVRMYGADATENGDYARIINHAHLERIQSLLDPKKTVFGGGWREGTLQMQPTILDGVTAADAVMQEEIFGPIFPILTVESMAEAERFILGREKPLAFYLFTESRAVAKRFLERISFGGGCINDTVIHLASSRMGFGGVGESGMGSYHGKKSFDTFSHEKNVVLQPTWVDLPLRYAPYQRIQKWILRLFLR